MITLSYIVLSCRDLVASRRFYQALGLELNVEQHGNGPAHLSTTISGIVVELYPAKTMETTETTETNSIGPRRIGFSVKDVYAVTLALDALGQRRISDSSSPHCFLDPDGRRIEISQVS